MKIAILNYDDQLGGASVASGRLAEALIAKGYKVDLIVSSKTKNKSYIKRAFSRFQFLNKFFFYLERLFFIVFEKDKSVRFAFSPTLWSRSITKSIDFTSYDIVHLHWINFGFVGLEELKKLMTLDVPIVWTLHDMWAITGGCHHSGDCNNFSSQCGNCELYLKKPSKNDLSRRIANRKKDIFGLTEKLALVACSEWLAKKAQLSSITKNSLITNIPNPLDTHVFNSVDKTNAKQKLGLEPNSKFLLFVAVKTSILWKGFHFLKKALEIVHDYDKSIRCLVIGNHDSDSIKDLGMEVISYGQIFDQKRIIDIYNAADVFVSSSLYENLPNTIMEAMSCNTPCVAFGVGGIPEMIDHEVNGYVAQPKNSVDLAKGIMEVLTNKGFILEEPRKKVLESYSQDIVAEQYIELYEKLL